MQAREDLANKAPAVSKKPESSNTRGAQDKAPLDADKVRLAERIRLIMDAVSAGLIDRDYVVKMAVLAVLAGQNIFLYGPPGTAKSMLSRRLASIVRGSSYFEHLMHRFCTPEEIFGPVSLSELKKDNYERKTAGYLPEADFAFLDEIWKSSPAVLNTLLTIINEHSFHNGSKVMTVPLRSLAVASNEIPDAESGMEALYDRFPVRIPVFPVKGEDAFRHLLRQRGTDGEEEIQGITPEEYQDYLSRIGEDNDLHYDVKILASQLLLSHTGDTFVTPVFNGSASLRDAAGQMIENVTKSVRRKEAVNDAYYEKLYADMVSLYHLNLDGTGASAAARQDLGPLPHTAVVLLVSLACAWVLITLYFCLKQFKKRKAEHS